MAEFNVAEKIGPNAYNLTGFYGQTAHKAIDMLATTTGGFNRSSRIRELRKSDPNTTYDGLATPTNFSVIDFIFNLGEADNHNIVTPEMAAKFRERIREPQDQRLMVEPKYKVGERVDVIVPRFSAECNFDRACESAQAQAAEIFGLNDDGYILRVIGNNRSADTIVVEFQSIRTTIGYRGTNSEYKFKAWVERNKDL